MAAKEGPYRLKRRLNTDFWMPSGGSERRYAHDDRLWHSIYHASTVTKAFRPRCGSAQALPLPDVA
jgi:hypothetical protein